jgi:hypothetical protein
MMRSSAIMVAGLLAVTGSLRAQDGGRFAITRGSDTMAVERYSREDVQLTGDIVRVATASARERLYYRATLADNQSAPLIEVSAWRAEDPEGSPARQNTRVIFKGDSVAVDEVSRWSGGVTQVFATAPAAVPYLNLSTALLELATQRAAQAHGDSLTVPFFNLGGGQTLAGMVRRLGIDSVALQIGSVEFRLRVDSSGRILGGSVPSQGLTITRAAGR